MTSFDETPLSADLSAALEGQYALERELGRGGMGVVYLARDLKLDRFVAIKTLPPHLAGDPVIRRRFLREARTAGALAHPHIVPIHRADEVDGQVFFVMGFIDGESLAARVRSRGSLSPRETVSHLRDVAEALAYAHSHNIIHRDVKAENILVDGERGRAMVTDFGIARLAEAAPLTATGQMLGTVHYLSPEQISGETVDARSDLYALGVVGYFALTGRFPFDAELASAVLVAHVTKPLTPVASIAPAVAPAVAAVIERCLEKDPRARYQSCDALIQDLSALLAGPLDDARLDGAREPAARGGALVSDTEVGAILRRAAELDGMTGGHRPPLAVVRERDAARDRSRTSGLQVSQVRDAAVEAGIAPRHVEHALAEHGLAPAPVGVRSIMRAEAAPVTPEPATSPPVVVDLKRDANSLLLGKPTVIEYEVVVDGEMPMLDFDILLETLKRRVGEVGVLSADGRSFRWVTHHQDQRERHSFFNAPIGGGKAKEIEVRVLPAAGKTSIFVRESLGYEKNVTVGLATVAGILALPITWGLLADLSDLSYLSGHPGAGRLLSIILPILWTGEIGGIFFGMRALFRRAIRGRHAFLRELIETLGAQARDAIAAAQQPPPSLKEHPTPPAKSRRR